MTDLSKSQLDAILSALDGQPRNPNSKDAALRRIGAHAERFGLGRDDLLAAAAGLLDGRMSAADFRCMVFDQELGTDGQIAERREEAASDSPVHEQGEPGPADADSARDSPAAAGTAPQAAVHAAAVERPTAVADRHAGEGAASVRQQLLAACQAAAHWLQAERERPGEATPDEILVVLRAAIGRAEGRPRQHREPGAVRPPRQGSKEAQVIALLRRPEGATIAQIVATTGWQQHTVRGFFAGALKRRRGLPVISEKAQGGERVYRIDGGCSRERC